MITFSIIIPTTGRESLARTWNSIFMAGIELCDEILIIGDGPQPGAFGSPVPLAPQLQKGCSPMCGIARYIETAKTGWMGNVQRNVGLDQAKGSHILFMDDDDTYRPDVFPMIRRDAKANPGKILMYRMEAQAPRHPWKLLWDVKDVFCGNIGVPMFVLPNIPHLLARFPEKSGAELEFLFPTLEKWPGGKDSIVWKEETIADIY